MAKTDEGEFELILGNRQLISVFLIVVILLGVFFAMGYIIGRNSSQPATEARNTPGGKQMVVESASRKDTEQAPATQQPTSTDQPPATAAPDTKSPSNPPAAEKTQPVKREPANPPPPAPPEKVTEPSPERPLSPTTDEPSPGHYWQVAANPRSGAEVVAAALRKKGMHVTLVPVPDKNLFRVLVGPYPDASAAATVRTQLEDAGFKSPIPKRF